MTTAKTRVLLAILLLTCAGTFASERSTIFAGLEPKPGLVDLGILFNTKNLLLGMEEINGGVGAKVGLKDWTLRGVTDLQIGTAAVSIDLSAVLEKHLWPGPVSLYWGPAAGLGFATIRTPSSGDDFTRNNTLPFDLGCVLGVEFFIFESLSVFVEYEAALELKLTTERVIQEGSAVSSTTEFSYLFDVGIGNNAMFGIVFYIMRRDHSPRRDSADQEEDE